MTGPAEGLTILDRYTLLRPLGEGGMAEVWLARDERGGQVAVKVLSGELARRDDMRRLFARETAYVQRLDHPGIARCLDTGELAGRPFIVTEFIDGPDLSSARGRPAGELAGLFAGVADALAEAHRHGIIHRDLKPANVILGPDGRPRLVDFGISAVLDDGEAPSGGGSGEYASPEQRAGAPPAVSDDAWGLGMLIRRTLAPGDGDTALAKLADRLTAASPAERPSDLSAVRDELRGFAAGPGEPAPASGADMVVAARPVGLRRPGGPLPGVAARSGRSRTWLWASLGVLVAILAAVVFVLPGWVAEQEAAAPPEVRPPAAPAEDPKAEIRRLVAAKRAADEVRSDLDAKLADLEERAVERWAPAGLEAVRAGIARGEEAYARRDFEAAGTAWQDAAGRAAELTARIPAVRADALAAGDKAIQAGEAAAAREAFSLAVAVDPDSVPARAGLARAEALDEVLAAMAAGAEAEREGRLADAREAYARAVALDPEWTAATQALTRVDQARADARFVEAMSRGYAALERGEYTEAWGAFERAAGLRPGSAEARDGLAQVEAARRETAVQRYAAEARAAEEAERWDAAVAAWRNLLGEDGSVAMAQDRLVRAQARAELDARLEGFLGDPFRMTSEPVARAAEAAMQDAADAGRPRERLDRQLAELARQLALARTPVDVVLESDGQTEVVLYRVGRLGTFSRRELELKPGRYTAVGSRPGYRDIRREFVVRPGQPMPGPVVVVSEEPI